MKVFISADIEGTAGITSWNEAEKTHEDYQEFRAYMTAEVVAACEGALAAGATEIVIKDAHDTGRNLILSELPPSAEVVRGWSGHPFNMMFGISADYDAAIFTGYHNKAGSDTNPLAHSFNGRISRLLLNGEVASEFTINAMTAAYNGVPPVFLSGDRGMCAEATMLVQEITTVAVSEGFGPATRSMSPARARAEIREGVQKALSGDLAACRLTLPESFELEIEFNNPVEAYRGSWYPDVEHPTARTLRYRCTDYFNILRALRFTS